MTEMPLESLDDHSLLWLYEKAATDHGRWIGRDLIFTNQAADTIAVVYREIRQRGLGTQNLLLQSLNSADDGVRMWAAAHALEFAPEAAVPVLEALSYEPKRIGLSARTTLKLWHEGKLRFP